jgi:transcription antitermination factor NusG
VSGTIWHLAVTKPQAEALVAVHLQRAGYRAFAPHCYFRRPVDRHRAPEQLHQPAKRQVFIRYVFFGRIDPETGFRAAEHTPGVVEIVRAAGSYAVVNHRLMERLMARCEPDGWMPDADDLPSLGKGHSFAVGDQVQMTAGPFMGLVAQIARLDGRDTVEISMEIFGASRSVKVHASGVAAVA